MIKGSRVKKSYKFLILNIGLVLVILAMLITYINITAPRGETQVSDMETEFHQTININTADMETLCLLPGIGETFAKRIIEHRQTVGPFRTVADLFEIEGMGEKKVQAIQSMISFS